MRRVLLPSGGEIVMEETEALVSIDVNTGSHKGDRKDGKNFILQANIEAAVEVCRQMRLRNLGGLVIIDFIDMKNKNSDLKNESLKWRRKNLETEEILQEKDQALTKAFQNFIDMKAESLELDRDKVQNTEIEDMKQLIEVEILMSENLKLTKEITFLNTNAQVNDLELTRMRTELEKGGSKEQEMVKLLYQKDEAITKLNSELMEEKQQNAKILEVKDHALTKASKQLIDMKAQVTIHVQEIVQNVLEINNLKEELANER